jgi:signal transduction histidine kinase
MTTFTLAASMMNERARAVGAKFEIHSEPGKGTEIILYWQAAATKEST